MKEMDKSVEERRNRRNPHLIMCRNNAITSLLHCMLHKNVLLCPVFLSFCFLRLDSNGQTADNTAVWDIPDDKVQSHQQFVANNTDTVKQKIITKPGSDYLSLASLHEKAGMKFYDTDPDSALLRFKKAAYFYGLADRKKKETQCFQNIAFIYDESLNDPENAVLYAQKALDNWKMLHQSIEIANMLKYVGFLRGLTGDFDRAKQDVRQAINMYSLMEFEDGLAVALLNMARVYRLEHQTDSCIIFAIQAKEKWKKNNNVSRIFNLNNDLLEAYLFVKDLTQCKNLIAENNQYMGLNEIYWKDKSNFYRNVARYHEYLGDLDRKKIFLVKSDSIQMIKK
jgi:tetratricopeptide (TPR) repeat protein